MLAINNFMGVTLAEASPGVPIPEIGAAAGVLDNMHDVHFGINSNQYDGLLNMGIAAEADLAGLGPRILDLKNRGGRTAEDTWFALQHGAPRQRPATPGFQAYYDILNQTKPVKKQTFSPGSLMSNVDQGGQKKYQDGAPNKGGNYAHPFQHGVRWSKTALEHVAATGRGHIHFHLDGMGSIGDIVDRSGGYAYNVTSRELRYLHRNWGRFQQHVIFYNGYTAHGDAVRVQAPWLWMDDSTALRCMRCKTQFTFFTRKHHCRQCGRIFCSDCSSHTKDIANRVTKPGASSPETGAVRLCDGCYFKT
jgi:hypothetical protein